MLLRVPVELGSPRPPAGVTSYVVIEYHDDATATIRPRAGADTPGLDGLLARLRNVAEPRTRRALQLEIERLIDSLEGAERQQAIDVYRGS